MASTYRSYDITPHPKGGFSWKDERGFEHFHEFVTETPYATEEAAMDDVDRYRRNLRTGAPA